MRVGSGNRKSVLQQIAAPGMQQVLHFTLVMRYCIVIEKSDLLTT
jgi:hypothetical protein